MIYQSYIQPEFLKKGDSIGIVASARKVSPEEVLPAAEIFQKQGYKVIMAPNLFASDHQFAGNDAMRTQDFQFMLDHPDVKAIVCARGGYGSVRIIDKLDFRQFFLSPKWICGFSDVCVFHSHLHQEYRIQSLHSLMPLTFPKENESKDALNLFLACLRGDLPDYSIPPHPLNRYGMAEGIVCGGNLSIIYSLSSSVSDIDTNGKILFLEDLDEYLYHIDRMMMNLKRSGKLSQLKALVVGGMSEMRDNTIPFGKTAEEIIAETVAEYDYPLIFNFPAGHIQNNCPLFFGAGALVDVKKNHVSLSFKTSSIS